MHAPRDVSDYRTVASRIRICMSSPTHDVDEFVPTVLEWLDGANVPPETVDDTFTLLADRRRRLTLKVVKTYGESLTLPDVAEEVARHETGRSLVDITAETVTDVYISLYHDHIPRLVEVGLLEYEQERDLVRPKSVGG